MPNESIPIARTAGGDILCLNLGTEKYGHVFLWDHERELMFEEGKMTIDHLYHVAVSFNKFLDIIEPYNPTYDLNDYEIEEVWIDPEFLKELGEGNED